MYLKEMWKIIYLHAHTNTHTSIYLKKEVEVTHNYTTPEQLLT